MVFSWTITAIRNIVLQSECDWWNTIAGRRHRIKVKHRIDRVTVVILSVFDKVDQVKTVLNSIPYMLILYIADEMLDNACLIEGDRGIRVHYGEQPGTPEKQAENARVHGLHSTVSRAEICGRLRAGPCVESK